jgi:hypothetical protein
MDNFHSPRFESDQSFGLPPARGQDYMPGGGQSNSLGRWALKSIWFYPRDTIRVIVDNDPERHVNLLIIFAGMAESLDRASDRNAANQVSMELLIFLICVVSPWMSMIGAWFYTHLIRISGDWLGGYGEYYQIKAAIGWSAVPTVVSLLLWIPLLVLFGREIFTEEMPSVAGKPGYATALVAFGVAQIVLGIWALILLCNTIAEVQGYRSAWKGFGNLILAGLIIMIPILVVVFGVGFLTDTGASQ